MRWMSRVHPLVRPAAALGLATSQIANSFGKHLQRLPMDAENDLDRHERIGRPGCEDVAIGQVAPFAGEKSADLAPFSRQDLGAAFLRGADAFPGQRKAETDARGVAVACRECDACPVLRAFLLENGTATVLEEVGYGDSGPRVSLTYGVQREVDGHLLPFHIHLRDLARGAEVDIRIQAYEVNPELRDSLFAPAG